MACGRLIKNVLIVSGITAVVWIVATLDWEYSTFRVTDNGDAKVDRLDSIKKSCGQLCDFNKTPTPSHFLDSRTAEVDCRAIFLNEEIDQPLKGKPPNWDEVPVFIQKALTQNGSVGLTLGWYEDNSDLGVGMPEDEPTIYPEQIINSMVENVNKVKPGEGYGWQTVKDITAAIQQAVPVEGKHVLVIGSQSPWMEAILLYYGAAKITTLEYGKFASNHSQLSYMRPNEFRSKYLNGTLPVYDVVFTYSSVEHSGLGRYGDALNPWGDILTIARAWCASSPVAQLAIAVPVNQNVDCIAFNAHRIYGKILYPFLVTNWKFNWSSVEETETGEGICHPDNYTQPVYVFNSLKWENTNI